MDAPVICMRGRDLGLVSLRALEKHVKGMLDKCNPPEIVRFMGERSGHF